MFGVLLQLWWTQSLVLFVEQSTNKQHQGTEHISVRGDGYTWSTGNRLKATEPRERLESWLRCPTHGRRLEDWRDYSPNCRRFLRALLLPVCCVIVWNIIVKNCSCLLHLECVTFIILRLTDKLLKTRFIFINNIGEVLIFIHLKRSTHRKVEK